jgi:apolipoprotein N-acyltransferase
VKAAAKNLRYAASAAPEQGGSDRDAAAEDPGLQGWRVRYARSTLAQALAGSLLMWASLPPLDLAPLAWVAPLPWLLLIRRRELAGRRPYAAIWLAGFAFWLPILHWLRLPCPATVFGWFALSFYLAFYVPVFVGLARVAVHRGRWPIMVAAPVVWTGLELARAHLLTGFTMASLGHTQYRWIELIQVSDLAGTYGVSFLVMFAAACLARMLPGEDRPWAFWPLAPAVAVLGAALIYGFLRTGGEHFRPGPKIALIQGSIDTQIKDDPDKQEDVMRQYLELTQEAVGKNGNLDLIVWPETMFRYPLLTYRDDVRPAVGEDWTVAQLKAKAAQIREYIADVAKAYRTPLLLGVETRDFGPGTEDRYNTALHVDRSGRIIGRYDKMHPVMFGEYIPFGDTFPWLYQLSSALSGGLAVGKTLDSLDVDGSRAAANICFESVLPHLIRRQVNELRARGREPDFLVNLTNDGWFYGSSELDIHLRCGVFRAVECRKPFLIAANTGFSAVIDGDGRIRAQGPRRETKVLVAEVPLDDRTSPYLSYGDWPAGLCLGICVILAAWGLAVRIPAFRRKKT